MKSGVFIFLFLFSMVAKAEYLCSAHSDQYKPYDDGSIFSKTIPQLGAQGTSEGHLLLHETKDHAFWLVAGTLIKNGKDPAKLIDFYVEIHNKHSGNAIRAKSGQGVDQKEAQIELLEYPKNSFLYQGILIFSCKEYSFE